MNTSGPTPRAPGLRPAAVLLVLQAVGFVALAVLELLSTQSSRPVVGITTGLAFAGYAVLLAIAGRGVLHARRWARSLAAFTQLLHVPVAWGFVGGTTVWVAVGVIALSVTVLVLLFLPTSTAAFLADSLTDGDERETPA